VGLGRHVLPFPELFDEMDVEISDTASGHPVDRHVGSIFRGLSISMDMPTAPSSLVTAEFVDPPSTVQIQFVDRERSGFSGRAGWERRLAEEQGRRSVEGLRQSGRVAFYLGSLGPDREGDRLRAVAAIRRIIQEANSRVWIWDKYFGAPEVVEFLTAVADRRTDVRVMTSVRVGGVGVSALDEAARWLRNPPGVPGGGLRSFDLRLGPKSSSHDRFLLTEDRCLILGCSLNQLGKVCSSTLEFPDREAVERAFVEAWQDASPVGS
jgi:hypothetical protein